MARFTARLSVSVLLTIASVSPTSAQPTFTAHCRCKVIASGCFTPETEVHKQEKGGYVQPVQQGKCRDWCKGLWDSPGAPLGWAQLLPNACGDVTLRMEAELGTMGYHTVRGPQVFNVGGHCETNCTCPEWHWLHSDGVSCVIGAGCSVPGIPNQSLAGNYFFWEGNLYQITGPATCEQNCVQ